MNNHKELAIKCQVDDIPDSLIRESRLAGIINDIAYSDKKITQDSLEFLEKQGLLALSSYAKKEISYSEFFKQSKIEQAKRLGTKKVKVVKESKAKKKKILGEKEEFFSNDYSIMHETKKIAVFFKEHDLAIVEINYGPRTEDYYDVAKRIWKAKDVLVPFIKNIPACVNDKTREFDYNTESLSDKESSQLRSFCKDMQDNRKWFTFEKTNKSYHIKLPKENKHIKFFTGVWAEEVSIYLLVRTLNKFRSQTGRYYKLFWNVCLKKFGSETQSWDMELDLVVQIEGRFYIFEIKTGKVLAIDKWVDRTRLFNSEKSKYITCTSNEKLEPRTFFPYVLFALPTLEEQFLKLLSRDFPKTKIPQNQD